MRRLGFKLAPLATCVAVAAVAQVGPTALYQSGSWTVYRITASAAGDPPSHCSARSGNPSAFFELIGTPDAACISAEAAQWRFRERDDEVGFFVGNSGFFIETGHYFSNGLQFCGPRATIDVFVDTLMRATGQTIDVYDHQRQKIGSFPKPGIETAVKRWRACTNAL